MGYYNSDDGFEHVQHIVTETASEYYARKQCKANELARVKWFNIKLMLAGMGAFFIFMGVLWAIGG